MNECYICADSTPPLISDVCMCKNRFVHPECQKKLVDTLETRGECSVCKTAYKNVHVQVTRRLSCQYVAIRFLNTFCTQVSPH